MTTCPVILPLGVLVVLLMPLGVAVGCRFEYTDDFKYFKTGCGLTQVPMDIPADAIMVDLDANGITHIDQGAFARLKECGRLLISGNELSHLQSGTFDGLESLEKLQLYNNDLTYIEGGTFRGLTHCTSLSLDKNKLTLLWSDMFEGLQSLRVLDLDSNDIFYIEAGVFVHFTKCTHLWLHRNRLTILHEGMFQGLESLKELSLSANNISNIDPGTFTYLKSLQNLYLHGNRLSTLHQDVFSIPSSINVSLSLGLNPLLCDTKICWLKQAEWDGWLTWKTDSKPNCANFPGVDWNNVTSDQNNVTSDCTMEAQHPVNSSPTPVNPSPTNVIGITVTVVVTTVIVVMTVGAALVKRCRRFEAQERQGENDRSEVPGGLQVGASGAQGALLGSMLKTSSGHRHEKEMQDALVFDGYETIAETMDLVEHNGRIDDNAYDHGQEVNKTCARDAAVISGERTRDEDSSDNMKGHLRVQKKPPTMEIECQSQYNRREYLLERAMESGELGVRVRHRHRQREEAYLRTPPQPHFPQSHPLMSNPQIVYPPLLNPGLCHPSTSHPQHVHPSQAHHPLHHPQPMSHSEQIQPLEIEMPQPNPLYPVRSHAALNVNSSGMNPCPRRRVFKSHQQMSHTERRYQGGEVSSVRSGTRVTELRKLFESDPSQFDCSMNRVTSRPFAASFAHPATKEHPAHPVHRNHSALPARHDDLYVQYAHSTRPSHCAHHHAHYAHSCRPHEDYAHPAWPHPNHLHLAQSGPPRGHRSLYCDPWIYSRSTQEHIYEKVDQL